MASGLKSTHYVLTISAFQYFSATTCAEHRPHQLLWIYIFWAQTYTIYACTIV